MAKSAKTNLEILLVRAEINGLPERKLLKSRNLGAVDLIWPRTGVAKKSAAREMVFKKGVADFTSEAWTNRVLYREEIEGRCGFAVTITEPVTVQLARRFVRLTAKYALRMGANYAEKAMVSFGDIATSPVEASAQMIGEKDTPKATAQGARGCTACCAVGRTKRRASWTVTGSVIVTAKPQRPSISSR